MPINLNQITAPISVASDDAVAYAFAPSHKTIKTTTTTVTLKTKTV